MRHHPSDQLEHCEARFKYKHQSEGILIYSMIGSNMVVSHATKHLGNQIPDLSISMNQRNHPSKFRLEQDYWIMMYAHWGTLKKWKNSDDDDEPCRFLKLGRALLHTCFFSVDDCTKVRDRALKLAICVHNHIVEFRYVFDLLSCCCHSDQQVVDAFSFPFHQSLNQGKLTLGHHKNEHCLFPEKLSNCCSPLDVNSQNYVMTSVHELPHLETESVMASITLLYKT